MGSDSRIYRDYGKADPRYLEKMEEAVNREWDRHNMATTHLKERGYEPYLMKRDKEGVRKIGYKNPILGKTLRVIAPIGAVLGAASYSDAAGAAVDAVVPGGVEELGVSDEQRELDRRYREILKQRSQ